MASAPQDGIHRIEADAEVLQAVIGLSSHLDLPTVLKRFVQASADLTGSRYGALSVLGPHGHTSTFVHTGVGPHATGMIEHPPVGLGVLGNIPAAGTLRLNNVQDHPAFRGFPSHHPEMKSFLGVAVRVRDRVYGYLYLADKSDADGFTTVDERLVLALASAAAVAIENAQLYESSQRRAKWLTAAQEITTTLLTGADEEEALLQIAARAREVADADAAALILPSLGDRWMIEIAEGIGAGDLLGQVMPPDGRSMSVLHEGNGLVVESLSRTRTLRVEALRRYGPAMYAPMRTSGNSAGVLLLLREIGGPVFAPDDLTTAESFAGQAALALALAESRHAHDVAALLDERERIARDLHDLAIQQLFATGMQLETVRRRAARGVDASELTHIVESALDNVDETVRQIRLIVHALRDPDADVGLVERLRREASLARTGLGFAPSLVVEVEGRLLDAGKESDLDLTLVDNIVTADVGDDVVAVVREGLANAARHAQASSVQVRVKIGAESGIVVEVEDDGAGIPAEATRRSGLENLAARARRHGGTFAVRPNEHGDTTLLWQVPTLR